MKIDVAIHLLIKLYLEWLDKIASNETITFRFISSDKYMMVER